MYYTALDIPFYNLLVRQIYRENRSVDDAVCLALNSVYKHLDKRNTYARMLFIDYSSAFNTIIPFKLYMQLTDLGLCCQLCNWIYDFLSDRSLSQSDVLENLYRDE